MLVHGVEVGESNGNIAVVTGSSGQDGSYLIELLLKKGYKVVGLVRRLSIPNTYRINHLMELEESDNDIFNMEYFDLIDDASIRNVIKKYQPTHFFNTAAMSHVAISFPTPIATAEYNAIGVTRILEAIKEIKPDCRFLQCSSSEMFGLTPPPQHELTAMKPSSPYGCFPKGTKIISKIKRNHRYGKVNYLGTQKIEEINKGDTVLSYNKNNGKKELKKVIDIMKRESKKLFKFRLSNGNEIECTGEHPFYVVSNGEGKWVEAKDLSKNDKLIQYKYAGLQTRINNLTKDYRNYININGKKILRKGKSYNKIYGEDKSNKIKKKLWGNIPWNKGLTKHNCETLRIVGEKLSIISCSKRPEVKEKIRKTLKKLWADPIYRDKQIKSQNRKINKGEQILLDLLNKWFPDKFKYVGDGKLWIGNPPKNPDFIHKEFNKVIEYNGSYWHTEEESKIREELFKENEFDCLTIWDYEIKDKKKLKDKIETFIFNSNVEIVTIKSIEEKDCDCEVFNFSVEGNNNYFANGILVHNCAKLYAFHMVRIYREGYGLFACNSICFNHEGVRRGVNFVTRKITRNVAEIVSGKRKKMTLGNLEAKRDWGSSKDYVEAMELIINHDKADDFVIATRETHTIKEYLNEVFSLIGLNWKDYVEISDRYKRPLEVPALLGDPTKLENTFDWRPKTKFKELVTEMLEADLKEQGIESIEKAKEMMKNG